MILLHGRGMTGRDLGVELLTSRSSDLSADTGQCLTLREHLPDMKIVFPTAKAQRAKFCNNAVINQWFDSVAIQDQDVETIIAQHEALHLEGLTVSGRYLINIVNDEASTVGVENVFIGGFSQGCAMGMHLLLSCEGRLGGFVGMSGWLPLIDDMEDILTSGADAPTKVCNFVRKDMGLPLLEVSSTAPCLGTPVLLGHGTLDDIVLPTKGRRAATFLEELGMQVDWKAYVTGHSYGTPRQIDDIVAFLQSHSRE